MTAAQLTRARQLRARGYGNADVAQLVGVPYSTLVAHLGPHRERRTMADYGREMILDEGADPRVVEAVFGPLG